ncbi:MAG: heavy metal translocating P-type ATPase [Deltaproteobacteria bacterium]|nr:heavy metal translocating P-type ATPase [Deltaproteobacteria bacterium]
MSLSSPVGCTHCGLPVAQARREDGVDAWFCCHGCRTAHALIVEHGLESFYRQAGADERRAAATGDGPRPSYDDLDRARFVEAHTTVTAPGEREATLGIEGMHCAACIWLLEKLPRVVPGVVEARVDWRRASLRVRWQTEHTSLAAIAEAVSGLGYRPHPEAASGRERHGQTDHRQLVSLGIAFAAAGNNMLIALSLYLGMFLMMAEPVVQLLRGASCVVGMVSLLGPGRVFFVGAWAAWRSRTPHMDLPVALGLAVGGVAGLVNTVTGQGEVYFDTLSALVFLLLLGRFIQARQQRRAAALVEVLYSVTPRTARRVVDGEVLEVPALTLEPGDWVQVRAGEVVPADGTVLRGRSAVDHKVLTGESRPCTVEPGASLAAGAINLRAALTVRVDATGEDTRMGRILADVEPSAGPAAQVVRLADRIGGWFVVTVVIAAVVTLVGWLVLDPTVAVDHAVALLIVACPCALALATPLAISVAIGRAARAQILIKGGDVLQRLATPGVLWLDKTGTLTQGCMSVLQWDGDATALAWVTALQRHSSHPVARALVEYGATRGHHGRPTVTDVDQSMRGGIEGRVDGHRVLVGNAPFVEGRVTGPLPPVVLRAAMQMVARVVSPVFVAVDGQVVAVAGVGDPLRPEAASVVGQLQERGWEVGILSGDHPDVVAHVGRALGLSAARCHGGLLPRDKVAYVRQRDGGPSTVMVGDGVNDGAALAAATVGIAVREGAESGLDAAPVYLGSPGLAGLVELVDGSRSTLRTIRRNFAVSLAYNAVSIGLAAFGLIGPLTAAVLMPLSSLSVVGMSLALRWRHASP